MAKAPPAEVEEEDVWGGLDPSTTLLIHGLDTDWIEEEMADDDDFRCRVLPALPALARKDVLEQKVRKVVEEIGLTRRIAYKVGRSDEQTN